jgi:hypothetical protein
VTVRSQGAGYIRQELAGSGGIREEELVQEK